MTQAPPFRKIFDGVATREQMFELFNRVPDCPCEDRISGKAFECPSSEHLAQIAA